jgi:transcriptional regulator with XRE-family HTH domain
MEKEYERTSLPSERLKEALELRGMKQVELSEKSGISKPNISCYLSGKYEPKQDALYKMGKALDVAEMWLAGHDVSMERPADQKENDALADLVERMRKEKDFKELIFQINALKPEQLPTIKNLLEMIQENSR